MTGGLNKKRMVLAEDEGVEGDDTFLSDESSFYGRSLPLAEAPSLLPLNKARGR